MVGGMGTTRRDFFVFGAVMTSRPFMSWKDFDTEMVPAWRSTLDGVRANNSPIRSPVQKRTDSPTLAGYWGTKSMNISKFSGVQKCFVLALFSPMLPAILAGLSFRP